MTQTEEVHVRWESMVTEIFKEMAKLAEENNLLKQEKAVQQCTIDYLTRDKDSLIREREELRLENLDMQIELKRKHETRGESYLGNARAPIVIKSPACSYEIPPIRMNGWQIQHDNEGKWKRQAES